MTHTVTSAPTRVGGQAAGPQDVAGPAGEPDDADASLATAGAPDAAAATDSSGAPAGSVTAASATAYDGLPDAVVLTDADGVVLVFNAAAANLMDVDAGSVGGRHVTEVLPLVDERGNDWWEASTAGRRLPRVTGQPERRLTYAGPTRDHDFNVTVRYTRQAGRLVQVALCLRDTASRERIERNRSDLVATVAHELRSPLTSVKGFTATLLAKWERFTDEQKKLMLNTVNTDADRVTRLLTELLDVSRIDAGRIQLRKQIADPKVILTRVLQGKVAAGAAGAERFIVHIDDELPEMWIDPDKIEQVLHNLVDNALRHGAGTVTVVLRGTETGAEVSVADEGDGVPEANASRVFTKFWRGASRGNGTGLGLYIAKALIEAHGGTIVVGRAPGGGAEFRFALPAGAPVFG
ncbi:PAS domain-containing protein [Frankia sp. AgB1.9]|uniref:sensor histidine kinase n=1 Tax=unclassified Frankia TaxID=2632575 RepID=UPI001933B1AB|nr:MULTISPECIES: ATP-binding protein [unclassified Frankia]MBL7491647.1 PAS domain-containing protein [Frankia sp. AgW1.1]MBL7549115.1 PAS domain-containing protein [Frankia sp. AgB1.9]MBL7619754.1 PAS domain-containing protein [Frankia sp. AgB1.8]